MINLDQTVDMRKSIRDKNHIEGSNLDCLEKLYKFNESLENDDFCPLLTDNAKFYIGTFIKTCMKRRELAYKKVRVNLMSVVCEKHSYNECVKCRKWKDVSYDNIPEWLKPHIIDSV